MYVYHNIENNSDIDIEQTFARQSLINQFKEHFSSYGYREITSPMFEPYHLYAKMNGTVNEHEMIKTIDNTGQVLVLRPDVTIPLTKQLAKNESSISNPLRYFYVLDVYRQAHETKEYLQRTQAGVEFFGNPNVEADAEVIALAAETLQQAQVDQYKIEIGHAGFFKQLTNEMNVSDEALNKIKQLIHAKNIPDLERLLETLSLDENVKEIIASLPFLYGKVGDVLEKTSKLALSTDLEQKLVTIKKIYTILEAYDVANTVVLDLSLINHMDYYSDIIFQGYIEKVGKPVIMGGRYNTLAKQFDATFPAIGFACDVDLLFSGMERTHLPSLPLIDFTIIYDKACERDAIHYATTLRRNGFKGITLLQTTSSDPFPTSRSIIHVKAKEQLLLIGKEKQAFTNVAELLPLMQQVLEDS